MQRPLSGCRDFAMTPHGVDSRSQLLRVLGLGFGVAVVFGGVVGQGILRGPGIVAAAVPDEFLILLLWLVGGALAAVTAFAWVELAASMPRAGGPYVFLGRAFGPAAGTLIGWVDWLQGFVILAYLAVVFAEYVHRLGFLSALHQGAIAVALLAIVTAINWAGTRTCGLTQQIGSAMKGLALLVLVALMFMAPAAPDGGAAPSPTLTVASVAIALRMIQNTYAGWNAAAYFCEEMHAPERNIARSMFGGIALITALYLLITAAMLHVLTPGQMAASTLPAADALGVALGPVADVLVNVLALVSLAAIANLYPMYLSRVAYAMARNRVLPAFIAQVSPAGTPRLALIVTTSAAALLAALGSYEQLIAITVAMTVSIDIAVNAAAIAMRLREPALPRPFRMPLFPLPALVGLLLNGLLLAAVIYEDPANSLAGLVVVAAMGLVYKARMVMGKRSVEGAPP
jgi:APA family basic amino acid/polyamine antiporter